MKQNNKLKRLLRRQKDYEKMVSVDPRLARCMRKPGSFKK